MLSCALNRSFALAVRHCGRIHFLILHELGFVEIEFVAMGSPLNAQLRSQWKLCIGCSALRPLVTMMSMALMYGGSASAVNLGPSLCKVNSALNPIRRTPKQQQKMISNARFTTPPTSLRSTSSSFMNSGLLRSEVDKFIHSIPRSSCGGGLSTECSFALSTEALRWLFVVVAMFIHSIPRSSCGSALFTECSVALSTEALRWLFGVVAVVLMLSKHTAIDKSFLVPLLALEAPGDVICWFR